MKIEENEKEREMKENRREQEENQPHLSILFHFQKKICSKFKVYGIS